jgi:hypothetical protein
MFDEVSPQPIGGQTTMTDKVKFVRTEESAKDIYRRYPGATVTTPAISKAANRALRDRWEAEAAGRIGSKRDSFQLFADHCRKYQHLARLALYTPTVEGVMEDVEVEALS